MNMDVGAADPFQAHGMTPLLEVENLHVVYTSRDRHDFPALAGVSFAIAPGETLGVLGESGSGKSTLAAALLRLLPPSGKISQGKILFEERDLIHASLCELEKLRGKRIATIFQEPSLALHPTIQVGKQVADVLAAHESLDRKALREKAVQTLAAVFPSDVERIFASYPHELSGGQRARVLIAQAIACKPSLIVADEPTASLDPTTQLEILSLFQTLQLQFNFSLILITHNPALLADFADRVLVLYAGRVAEIGPAASVISSPQHPYTRALLRCMVPGLQDESAARKSKLPVIAGDSPRMDFLGHGCAFEPRCNERMEICSACAPSPVATIERHTVSCFKYDEN